MGEIADMMLDGTLCQQCGGDIGDRKTPGYPRYCPDCVREINNALKADELLDGKP